MKVVIRHESAAIVNVDGREFLFFSLDCLHIVERNSDGKPRCGKEYAGDDKSAIIEAIQKELWK